MSSCGRTLKICTGLKNGFLMSFFLSTLGGKLTEMVEEGKEIGRTREKEEEGFLVEGGRGKFYEEIYVKYSLHGKHPL